MTPLDIVIYVLAFVVGALATGRMARAIYHDAFPPSAWLRSKWDLLTTDADGEPGSWNLLLHCPWCITHWIAGFTLLWYLLTPALPPFFLAAWWVWHGWWALSYVASMIIVRDEPAGDE
jgi:hypothetical protein